MGRDRVKGELYNQIAGIEKTTAPIDHGPLLPASEEGNKEMRRRTKSPAQLNFVSNRLRDGASPEGKAPMLYAYAVRFAPDWPSAACAAARRAIGTRKGEHET